MLSRAESRLWVERALRAIVLLALALMLWQSLRPATDAGTQSVRSSVMGSGALIQWARSPRAPANIQLQPSTVPTATEREWLAALAGAGSKVTWSGGLPPMMIEADPIASPASETRVALAAPGGSSVVLRDDIGVVDTLRMERSGISASVASMTGVLTAQVNGSIASAIPEDSLTLRRVLVIGTAGWESKFVVAALEEEGWKVDAAIHAAPGADVTQGSPAPIDTSRYSAIVALDAAATPYANRIVQFARSGGGVILEPQAAALDAMSPIRVGSVGRAGQSPATAPSGDAVTEATLPLMPLTALHADAVVIARRGQAPTVAARRIGAGRLVQLAFADTWRWRMAGAESSVRDHRRWWSDRVSSVAYAPATPRATNAAGDQAPFAGLVAAIGPASLAPSAVNFSATESSLSALLFALLAVALIGEVVSRRFRGAA